MKPLNKYIDHTLLKPEATEEQIIKLCNEAKEYDFFSVCVNSSYVSLAAKELKNSNVKIAAVVGFPLGACTTETKAFEADEACTLGASEIDMVINIGKLKSCNFDYIKKDIAAVVNVSLKNKTIVKVILETCLLTNEEIIKVCLIAKDAGAEFVKTSTGFSSGGATEENVRLMKETVGDSMQIKASGGIRDYNTAMAMIKAGADRLGTSASISIIKAQK